MLSALLTVAALACAIQAVRARRLLDSAIWLSGVSALLAILLYRLGAHQVAAIELSVGAGLVTVLFVFAIGMAGDEGDRPGTVVPRGAAWALVLTAVLLLGWLILPGGEDGLVQPEQQPAVAISAAGAEPAEEPLQTVIWQQRGLDVLVQVVLIFSGILGVLGLLAEAKGPLEQPAAEEVSAIRDRALRALEAQATPQEAAPREATPRKAPPQEKEPA
ncbi:MAG: Na(+)/H(+) antiporter subunit B [Candidatus Promineifilaceae bacterium]